MSHKKLDRKSAMITSCLTSEQLEMNELFAELIDSVFALN